MLKNTLGWLSLLFFTFLVGCGGGGGGGASGGGSTTPAAPTTYSISGTISGSSAASGVAVVLSGAGSATQSSDSSGNYSFSGLVNGSYTVTPSSSGYIFNPISTAVTVSGTNQPGKNFTMATGGTTYALSGSVSGATGVTITLSGAANGSVVSGAGGTYSFNVPNGTYTLTPNLTGYTFAPASTTVAISGAASTATTFVATANPVAHALSGTVSGAGAGVLITVTGPANATATTNSSGAYTFNLYDGTYTVTPSASGYTFNPNSAPVTMAGAAKTQNFVATANSSVKAIVNGAVTGAWIEGITVTLSGNSQTGTTTTNASGQYSFANLPSGATYTFTPTLSGYTFSGNGTAVIPAGSSTAVTATAISDTAMVATSYSVSGTVAYSSTHTGPIGIEVVPTGCTNCSPVAGTVIAAPGVYTIRGVPNGSYTLVAQMDAYGTHNPNANNPGGTAPVTISTNVTGTTVTLADPAAAPTTAPTFTISGGNAGALVQYNPNVDVNGFETATSYKLNWMGTATGSATFTAQGTNQTVYLLGGLANGSYSFTMQACVAATCGTATAAVPATIGATTGGTTVSGTVTYTGTATGPMYVAVHNNGGGSTFTAYVARVAAPTSGATYSITGVPAGNWEVAVIIDNNNNGVIDAGDFNNAQSGGGTAITTTGSGTVSANITLPYTTNNAVAQIGTGHQSNANYSVNAFMADGLKRVVGVTLFSGPNIALPVDMGMGNGNSKFSLYDYIGAAVPVVGDTYQFKLLYSDASTEIVSASVTTVLSSFATGLTVTPPTGSATPTFSWAAPANPPAGYLYTLYVYTTLTGSQDWYYPQNGTGFSGTSLVYNVGPSGAAPLSVGTGTSYTWGLSVIDSTGLNSATATSTFTP